MAKIYPRKLIVEGDTDKRVIPCLIEKNGIPWGDTQETCIVYIKAWGDNSFIDADTIYTELNARGIQSLGLIVDADTSPGDRWRSIRNACLPIIPNFPTKPMEEGFICELTSPTQVKFGIWMMPDNQLRGMLETFLAYLLPAGNNALWEYAQEVVKEAKENRGAPFIDNHYDKARIYTWLAWQNEPGCQLHQAIKYKILDPSHPKGQLFINWFKKLYDL